MTETSSESSSLTTFGSQDYECDSSYQMDLDEIISQLEIISLKAKVIQDLNDTNDRIAQGRLQSICNSSLVSGGLDELPDNMNLAMESVNLASPFSTSMLSEDSSMRSSRKLFTIKRKLQYHSSPSKSLSIDEVDPSSSVLSTSMELSTPTKSPRLPEHVLLGTSLSKPIKSPPTISSTGELTESDLERILSDVHGELIVTRRMLRVLVLCFFALCCVLQKEFLYSLLSRNKDIHDSNHALSPNSDRIYDADDETQTSISIEKDTISLPIVQIEIVAPVSMQQKRQAIISNKHGNIFDIGDDKIGLWLSQ